MCESRTTSRFIIIKKNGTFFILGTACSYCYFGCVCVVGLDWTQEATAQGDSDGSTLGEKQVAMYRWGTGLARVVLSVWVFWKQKKMTKWGTMKQLFILFISKNDLIYPNRKEWTQHVTPQASRNSKKFKSSTQERNQSMLFNRKTRQSKKEVEQSSLSNFKSSK